MHEAATAIPASARKQGSRRRRTTSCVRLLRAVMIHELLSNSPAIPGRRTGCRNSPAQCRFQFPITLAHPGRVRFGQNRTMDRTVGWPHIIGHPTVAQYADPELMRPAFPADHLLSVAPHAMRRAAERDNRPTPLRRRPSIRHTTRRNAVRPQTARRRVRSRR